MPMTAGDAPRVAPTPANLQLRNRLAQESVASPENAARVMRAWLAEGP
jgi:hypothetical protein